MLCLKRIFILTFLLATSLITSNINYSKQNIDSDAKESRPEFASFQVDSNIEQTIFCQNRSTLLTIIRSSSGSILLSKNKGFSWDSLEDQFHQTGKSKVDLSIDEIGRVRNLEKKEANEPPEAL